MDSISKLIFVTGGVVSSLGKGITAASLGRLLKARGYTVSMMKLDPYLNVDPGTMNPYQHGEVFVTHDGAETDLDLGHYERFIDEELSKSSNVTSGRIFSTVIERERRGGYNGGTVQIIPHITDEIKRRIRLACDESHPDFMIVEIGGMVGDIESQPFLESIRQLKTELPIMGSCFVHVTLVPYIQAAGELKSKPTQHSVKELLSLGIQPDVIVCRSQLPLNSDIRRKIALFCNVRPQDVIENLNGRTLYEVPLMLEREGLCRSVLEHLACEELSPDLSAWQSMVETELSPKHECEIAIVGKYVELHDAYLSVAEALHHGGIANCAKVKIRWIAAEDVERQGCENLLSGVDGIVVPGGFGERGLMGKTAAIRYARTRKIPFLGLCLGMLLAVIEYARNVCGMVNANSTEADSETPYPVIALMPDQRQNLEHLGGTLRLGAYACKLKEGSRAFELYGHTPMIYERHRHRYEVNSEYLSPLREAGLAVSGLNPERGLAEIVELDTHPFFIGVQFHPEFKSRPNAPHPLFSGLVAAALKYGAAQ